MACGQSVAKIMWLSDDTRSLFLHHNGATIRQSGMYQTSNRLSFQLITNGIWNTVLKSYHPTGLSRFRFSRITTLFLHFHPQIVMGDSSSHIVTQRVRMKGATGTHKFCCNVTIGLLVLAHCKIFSLLICSSAEWWDTSLLLFIPHFIIFPDCRAFGTSLAWTRSYKCPSALAFFLSPRVIYCVLPFVLGAGSEERIFTFHSSSEGRSATPFCSDWGRRDMVSMTMNASYKHSN